LSYWIIPITEENWRIVKEKNIYGVRKISKSIRKIQKNDYLIFYITKRNCSEYCGSFAGIYKVENNWYEERTLLWPDEQRLQKVLYPYKIKITPIITGNTPATNLINQLSFIKNKNKWFLYFRGTPANYDNPIPEEDAKIIQEHLSQQPQEVIASHEEAQYYLLKLGRFLGYVTHVAKQDQEKIVNNEKLGKVADVSKLPQWLIEYRSIRNPEDIDVLWLDSTGEKPVYAFEVSHTTDITKDATALQDLASIVERVFIVAPDNRKNEFERLEKSVQFRPLLREDKLKFISYSELLTLYNRARSLREILDKVRIRI